MTQDKYTAVWVSHSSMSDFLTCPRLYYLRNVYKDPKTHHKVNITSPALSLGQTVHDVLECLSVLPVEKRMQSSLLEAFETGWEKVSGRKGGFFDISEEVDYKERGRQMIQRVIDNPGPLLNKAVKIKKELPNYYLSLEDNIILCGKIDWLEYLEATDTLHVIDFKTGKHEEKASSLQLPIYLLLVKNCQKRVVSKASYWYLEKDTDLSEVMLPDVEEAHHAVLAVARKVKQARNEHNFVCPKGGCFACRPFEAILRGEAEYVGVSGYNQDIYVLN